LNTADIAISVESLGKRYRIGRAIQRPQGLRQALAGAAGAPFRYLKYRLSRQREEEILWALKDVSFEVRRGEVLGVIGKNGAGKSTLLKILSRITDPTEGRAVVRGRVNSLLEVGTGFHPELTGRENVYMNAALHGMRRRAIDLKFDEIVAFSGVEKFIDTPVKRYSSGMYTRLAFAVAAHLDPDVLIVDEVLAVGDQEFQNKCIGKMEEVTHQGRTVLFVSHNMRAVKSLCHRALLLEQGRKSVEGTVDTVVEKYLSAGIHHQPDGAIAEDTVRDGTGEARFRNVQLVNLRGQPVTQVYLGQPFRVAMVVEAFEPIEKAMMRVSVADLLGEPIATAVTLDRNGPAVSFPPGLHTVVVELDQDLLPRHFTLSVSMSRAKDGVRIDGLERCLEFAALSFAESGTDSYPWNTVHGYVRPRATWIYPDAVALSPFP
jgi:lipopolysaccharide transport system ATP-binding protein